MSLTGGQSQGGLRFLSHFECPVCGRAYAPDELQTLCRCGAPLLGRYRHRELAGHVRREELGPADAGMWRYIDFLPVAQGAAVVSLGEGWTPLVRCRELAKRLRIRNLFLKDEGKNPTGTFKDRGASVGVSRLVELGVERIVLATAGNAGASWAAYAARAGLEAHVVMPRDSADLNKRMCLAAGASLYLVDGLISDAGEAARRAARDSGWLDVSTLHEPFRVEGKKTMGFEIAEQLGWELPDAVVYPTGGGVGLIGIWKGFEELVGVGWVRPKRVRFFSVQAEGCAPIVKAFGEGKASCEAWENPRTAAMGIRVPRPSGDFLILNILKQSGGGAIAVSEGEMVEAVHLCMESEGVFMCLEGGAALAGLVRLKVHGLVQPDETVVIINTGTGMKQADFIDIERGVSVLPPSRYAPAGVDSTKPT